ncbi:hypothetical protein LPJ61_006306 [Coemansia biformis]|uniref:Uncharacterized protein n=1 Tax=Coemansia biformis TaxID=1286918 RepID=A0A9W7XRP5_9FUNG|nr:hypothetical protein LPJ61_006306 [Coemansia biformis]
MDHNYQHGYGGGYGGQQPHANQGQYQDYSGYQQQQPQQQQQQGYEYYASQGQQGNHHPQNVYSHPGSQYEDAHYGSPQHEGAPYGGPQYNGSQYGDAKYGGGQPGYHDQGAYDHPVRADETGHNNEDETTDRGVKDFFAKTQVNEYGVEQREFSYAKATAVAGVAVVGGLLLKKHLDKRKAEKEQQMQMQIQGGGYVPDGSMYKSETVINQGEYNPYKDPQNPYKDSHMH